MYKYFLIAISATERERERERITKREVKKRETAINVEYFKYNIGTTLCEASAEVCVRSLDALKWSLGGAHYVMMFMLLSNHSK